MSDTKAIREKINATLATRVRAGQGRECELILQLCDDLDAERERVSKVRSVVYRLEHMNDDPALYYDFKTANMLLATQSDHPSSDGSG